LGSRSDSKEENPALCRIFTDRLPGTDNKSRNSAERIAGRVHYQTSRKLTLIFPLQAATGGRFPVGFSLWADVLSAYLPPSGRCLRKG